MRVRVRCVRLHAHASPLLQPSDESSGENDEAYFADAHAESAARFHPPRQTDEQGYVVRQSVSESSTRPDYIIPVGSANGVWAMIKQVGGWKPEGWLALYKGNLNEQTPF